MNLRSPLTLTAATLALCAIGSAGVAQEPVQPAVTPPPAATTTTVTVQRTTIITPMRGVAPITYRDLVELMEAKLIAKTGSHDAAWILQGMHSRMGSDDLRNAREKWLRVWEWP